MPATRPLSSALMLLSILLAGCGKSGPAVAPVHGRVTLDGRPLEFADVTFQPDSSQRPSIGRTDAEGRYELAYKRGQPGAIVGPHLVQISVSPELVKNPPHIAKKFDSESDLHREVKPGDNEFNFELTTEAK